MRIVDFEDAEVSDPEFELADLVEDLPPRWRRPVLHLPTLPGPGRHRHGPGPVLRTVPRRLHCQRLAEHLEVALGLGPRIGLASASASVSASPSRSGGTGTGLTATYAIRIDWGSGFVANVTVKNGGTSP
jgi:hypothetical protein